MGDGPSYVKVVFAEEPLLEMLWEEYELCRAYQYIHTVHKSKDGRKEYPIEEVFPSHIANWPARGSLEEQPYMYIKVFRAFLEGEREGKLRKMERMRKS